MRLVLDTNVLIAAYVARGVCHELVEHCEREHQLVGSIRLLDEFEDKLLDKFKAPSTEARQARALLETCTQLVDPPTLDQPVCRDPDDDWVLSTADAGVCDCIVTGDEDLLVLECYRSIRILRPTEFWRFEAESAPRT